MMKAFLKRFLMFVSVLIVPFVALLIAYIHYDPFEVVNKYYSYYISGKPSYITLNRDYVSTETLINNEPTYHYDSYIMGNSRTRFYELKTWADYINSDKCFHFDASAESLYGIYKKIIFLDENHYDIKNILMILDYGTLRETNNSKGHLFIKHPLLSGQGKIDFQLEYFKTFCSFSFFPAYLDYKISGKIKDYMITGHLLDDTPLEYDLKYNEMRLKTFEDSIKANPVNFYNDKKMKLFFHRDSIQKYSPMVIKKEQLRMLEEINVILKKHHTNVKVVINPLYDQLKINSMDLETLKNIYGAENVFDFSGINAITNDYHNYYEESHYRPQVSDEIMKAIYQK